ncbi:MAG: hypothetical protein IKL76_03820 [Clostridia bacterium]|nr:hypothetical protein [Clostridia bacterium]
MNRELYYVQNPALGATAIREFVAGYYKYDAKPIPFPLVFLVIPIVFKKDLVLLLNTTDTKKGLAKISEKIFKNNQNDTLYSINNLAIGMREQTLDAFDIGLSARLYLLDKKTAMIYPTDNEINAKKLVDKMDILKAANRLGCLCAQLNLLEISDLLKVRF